MSLVQTNSSMLTGVLWYSTSQKWSLCYPKVYANRIRVIRRQLCIKPRTFDRAKKFVCVNWGSVLRESVLTKCYCTQYKITPNKRK